MGWGRSGLPVRSTEQLLTMRRAGLVVAEALAAATQRIEAGMTTAQVDAIAEGVIEAAGARSNFKGYYGFPAVSCISVNDETVHGIPGPRVLEDGDLVSIDCGAIVEGWHGDSAVTVVVGGEDAARPQDLDLSRATEDALWAGILALRDGERLHDVGAAVQDCIEAQAVQRGRTFGILDGFTGHGIGTEMHESPSVYNERVRERGPKVRVGNTVAIEPIVTLGTHESHELDDGWTVKTDDGSRGAHWEHTVAVTPGGLWVLTAHDGGASRLGDRYAPLD
ncbi:type I methionyl aminopeptidase [Dermacoccaceae bacterium W4C1]